MAQLVKHPSQVSAAVIISESWDWAPHGVLHSACSQLEILSMPPPSPSVLLSPPPHHALSQINYLNLKKKKKKYEYFVHIKDCVLSHSLIHTLNKYILNDFNVKDIIRAWWLSWLSICLQLRSWSQVPGTKPCIGLPTQWGVCFSLLLCLCPACAISLSQIKKSLKKKILY